jgi:hypothetical protein
MLQCHLLQFAGGQYTGWVTGSGNLVYNFAGTVSSIYQHTGSLAASYTDAVAVLQLSPTQQIFHAAHVLQ